MCPRSRRPLGTSDIRSEGVEMITLKKRIGSNRSGRATYISLAFLCLLLAVTLSAQAPKTEGKSGIVRQLSEVRFPAGEGPDCLQFFLENGDMKTGPSTAIMKAKPKCVVPPHYPTAADQLLILTPSVSTAIARIHTPPL